jgi:hypothetical protein
MKSLLLVEFKGFLGSKNMKHIYFISDFIKYLVNVHNQD